MKARTIPLSLSLLCCVGGTAAYASSVTLYGTIDTAVEYLSNISDGAGGKHSSVHFTNLTQSWPSLWGLQGSEDLGNGLSAVFALESGFSTGTGTGIFPGRLFGRQSWVGLKGDWGQLAFGRQYSMQFWSSVQSDIMGPNSYGLTALDGYFGNPRMDNAITYMGSFQGFRFGAAWARGRDNMGGTPATPTSPASANCGVDYQEASACQAYSVMLGYDSNTWGWAAAYDTLNGQGPDNNNTVFNGLGKDQKDRRWNLNGYLMLDKLKLAAFYLNRKNDAGIAAGLGTRSDLWSLAAAYPLNAQWQLDGSINHIRYGNADRKSGSWYYTARAQYSFSKRTRVYVSAAYIDNKGFAANSAASGTIGASPGPGNHQVAAMMGLRHDF